MAKFSFDDADDDHPAAASASEKRKREDCQAEATAGGEPLKARILVARGGEREGSAVVGAERAEGSGRKAVETVVGGEADGISVRIDPDVLDCSICFEPLRPPLYQDDVSMKNNSVVDAFVGRHYVRRRFKEQQQPPAV